MGSDVQQTEDGGYIVAGWLWTELPAGDNLYDHALLIKLDENGDEEWSKTLGGLLTFGEAFAVGSFSSRP